MENKFHVVAEEPERVMPVDFNWGGEPGKIVFVSNSATPGGVDWGEGDEEFHDHEGARHSRLHSCFREVEACFLQVVSKPLATSEMDLS